MSAHDHTEFDPSCFRCELSRDEAQAEWKARQSAARAEFAESCCGECPGGTCYVDAELEA